MALEIFNDYRHNSELKKKIRLLEICFKSRFKNYHGVDQVITLADIPFVKSTDEPLMDRLKNYKTLSYQEIDKKRGLARNFESPIFIETISLARKDGKTKK